MRYTREGDEVVLRMSPEEYGVLFLVVGYATGAAHRAGDYIDVHGFLDVANRLGNGNPNYTPYTASNEQVLTKSDVVEFLGNLVAMMSAERE